MKDRCGIFHLWHHARVQNDCGSFWTLSFLIRNAQSVFCFNLNRESQCDLASEVALPHTLQGTLGPLQEGGRCFSGPHVILVVFLLVLDI